MYKRQGYILSVAVDENNEAIGYKFVKVGKMFEDIRNGMDPKEAYEKNIGTYGRYADAPKYIDPVSYTHLVRSRTEPMHR